jgi:hypothetical protein
MLDCTVRLDPPGTPEAPVVSANDNDDEERSRPACEGFTTISSGPVATTGVGVESVTVTVKSKVPDCDGLPLICPPASVIPGGNELAVVVKV